MAEADILRRIQKLAKLRNPTVIQGIGDDCAVVRPDGKSDLVFTTDFVIEDRHFKLKEQTASAIGYRALARSLSDLAAMGSEPVFCLVSLAMPSNLSTSWTSGFYRGLTRLADRYGMTVAGGDLSSSAKVIVDVMCCGKTPRGKALLRSGAKPGDGIYVTGKLGKPWTLKPQPRIEEGIALRGVASAAMDLSDGISLDLQRMCLASGVAAELESALIPIYRGSTLERALHGGEDYELLFTSKKPSEFHRVGRIVKGNGEVRLDGCLLKPKGWDHFA